ncbi:MAG: hypothetical protein M3Z02_05595 [Actinomycetota bacterium]|nr:hypothetical protein [Actinomycetota bacterium]
MRGSEAGGSGGERRLWHVALTMGGHRCEPPEVLAAMQRLSEERPFLLAGRYAADRVELRYWEEADACEDACALALRLWGEHRRSAGLPAWRALAVEVVERDTMQARVWERREPSLAAATGWRPFPD